eukprot:1684114-Prymnesium_polylepis.1
MAKKIRSESVPKPTGKVVEPESTCWEPLSMTSTALISFCKLVKTTSELPIFDLTPDRVVRGHFVVASQIPAM